jgi:HK97 family phage major capsid protein
MSLIEFKKSGLPSNDAELGEHIEDIRAAVLAGGKATQEALDMVARDLKVAGEAVEASKRAEAKAKELEETVKAMHEAGRGNGGDAIERQLRTLPKVHKVEKDQDYRGKVAGGAFNVLAMSRNELKNYLSGEALAWALQFRRLNDQTLAAHDIMTAVSESSPARREAYAAKGGMKSLELWAPLQETVKQGARALDIATAGGASDWVPTLYSAEKFDDVRDKLQAASAIRFVPMPQSPWNIPTLLGFMTAYVIPEAQADAVGSNTQLTASDPTTSSRTLTAKKFATLSWFSRELEQDSIIPILPMYNEEQTYAQAFGIENAFVNGQQTATIDTGSDPGTTDVRDHVDGLRYNASLVGSTVDVSAGLTAEKLADMIRIGGKYADPNTGVFATGYTGLAKALVLKDGNGNLVYLTRERAGEAATLFSGAVGVLMGYPLAISGAVPQNLNAVGVIDGVTTTKSEILLFNKNVWLGGNRQGLEIDVDRSERFSYDQIGVRSIQRAAIRALLVASASRPHVVAGVGL